MKLKTIVTTLGVLGLTTAGVAFAAGQSTDAQVAQLQTQLNQLQAQVNAMSQTHSAMTSGMNMVQTNAMLAQNMLSTQTGVGTEMTILNARKAGLNGDLYIGGQLKGDAQYTRTSVQGSDSTTTTHQGISSDSGLDVLANINSWVSGFISIDGFDSGSSIAAKDAYMVFGNLNMTPVYGFAGRKDVDFGSFQTVNFFADPLTRFFEARGNTMGVGYAQNGFNGTFSVMNGGAQAGVMNDDDGDTYNSMYTKNANQINNFALNATYGQDTSGVNWNVGAGYLNGAASGKTNANTVGAWDVNAQAMVNNLTVMAEFDRTTGDVGNVTATKTDGTQEVSLGTLNKTISAWDLGAAYAFPVMGLNSSVNLDYSAIKLDATYSQYVLGYNVEAMKNIWVGLQYSYNKGDVASATSTTKNNALALVGTAYF